MVASNGTGGFTGFINDGYNRAAFIAEIPGIHDAVKITYRPCTMEERAQHGDDVANERLLTANKKAAVLAGQHIQSWSIPGVKPDSSAMLKLNLNLFNRLYQIVLGNDAGDEMPAAHGIGDTQSQTLPAAKTEEEDAKN
jgi:hypothetical protein